MEKLLSPDTGLMVWTIVTFLLTVMVLAKTAWKPLIGALEEREKRLKEEREAAEAARRSAERLKAELDVELARIEARAQEALHQGTLAGQKVRDEILRAAQEDAKAVLEKTRAQLEDEKDRLVRDLRKDVADLSVRAAERLLRRAMDPSAQQRLLDDFFMELEGRKGKAG